MGDTFKASESNTYNDYFKLYSEEIFLKGKAREDVYRKRLQTASKDKLIDVAIEGNNKYWEQYSQTVEKSNEIDKLQTELKNCDAEVALYSKMAYNSKLACSIAIVSCTGIIGVFYIYQFIKFRLKKYAEKIRTQTIEELKKQ